MSESETHSIEASGDDWICSCGAWGFREDEIPKHREMEKLREPGRKAERAVDEAYERNR